MFLTQIDFFFYCVHNVKCWVGYIMQVPSDGQWRKGPCSGLPKSVVLCGSVCNHQRYQKTIRDHLISGSYPDSQTHRVTAEWLWRGRTLMEFSSRPPRLPGWWWWWCSLVCLRARSLKVDRDSGSTALMMGCRECSGKFSGFSKSQNY